MKKFQYYLIHASVKNGDLLRTVVIAESKTANEVRIANLRFNRQKKPFIWRLPTEIFGEILPS